MSKEIYEQITNAFISSLEEARIPWRKPWSAGPRNFSTGSEYHGINFWLLSMIAEKNQWPNRWATFNQVKGLDGSIIIQLAEANGFNDALEVRHDHA